MQRRYVRSSQLSTLTNATTKLKGAYTMESCNFSVIWLLNCMELLLIVNGKVNLETFQGVGWLAIWLINRSWTHGSTQ